MTIEVKKGIQAKPEATPVPEVTQSSNPANSLKEVAVDRINRIPMSTSMPKFQVDEIPGWHLHWFSESRVRRAQQAGYELVRPSECTLNGRGVGTSVGNTDLGDCVTIVGSPGNNVERMVLMKLKEEWWQEDRRAMMARNGKVVEAIFGGEAAGVRVDDQGNTHTVDLPDGAYVGNRSRGVMPVLNRGVKRRATPRGVPSGINT